MSRKALIITIVLGLAAIIAGIIFIAGRESPSIQPEAQNTEEVAVSVLPNGWRLVKHPIYNISFEVPPAWGITVFENGRGKIEAGFLGAGVNAVVDINKENNIDGLNPESLLNQNKNNQAAEINRGSVKGVRYVTRLGSEHESGFISDSYLLIDKYFFDDGILTISCGLSGPNYKIMIATCAAITQGLKFIK